MSRRPHPADRGLAAVARVRQVREDDSRLGLRLAAADQAAREATAADLHGRLASAAVPELAAPGALLARRTTLALLGDTERDARDRAGAAARITDQARAHWAADRARLAAVEHLLERRAERRRDEADRRAAKEADDLAAQGWLRSRAGGES